MQIQVNILYLLGRDFILFTDNRAIQLIVSNPFSIPPARIENLTLRIQQFKFTVKQKPGKYNIVDYLSRYTSRSLNFDSELYKECAKEKERNVKCFKGYDFKSRLSQEVKVL